MPHDIEVRRNTGLIFEEQPNPTDYIRGIASGILLIERLSDGDWSKYRSTGEKQHSVYFDSMGCVSFSFNNAVESQINWLKATGKLTDDFLITLLSADELVLFKEFFNDAGESDLSDRALAKLSGTSRQGNSLSWVAITGRNFAVPERVYGYPRDQRSPVFDWDEFYKPIDPDLVKKYTDVFFKVFEIKSEWISRDVIGIHLKHAPIQIASGVCGGWNTDDPIKACERHNDHATVIDHAVPNVKYHLFDTYDPFGKSIEWGYGIDACLKLIVEIKKPPIIQNRMVVKENYLYQLVEGHGGFALGLNGNLIIDKVELILASWLVRNKGNTTGKTATATLADWNSVKHYNLKMEPVV